MENAPTVVVGDDSALARGMIVQAISDLGVKIIEAESGNGVIRAINKTKPGLVILDICMPYPDGLTVLRKMRGDPEFCDTPVIVCSVESGILERREAELYDIYAYVTKPIDLKALRSMVENALRGSSNSSANGPFIHS